MIKFQSIPLELKADFQEPFLEEPMAKKIAAPKAKAAPKLSKDEIQDLRDKLIVASYSRTLAQLASVHGGSFAAENVRLADELLALEKQG